MVQLCCFSDCKSKNGQKIYRRKYYWNQILIIKTFIKPFYKEYTWYYLLANNFNGTKRCHIFFNLWELIFL